MSNGPTPNEESEQEKQDESQDPITPQKPWRPGALPGVPEKRAETTRSRLPVGNVKVPQRQPIRRAQRKVRQGLVVSNKMDKTVVVEVIERGPHPLYGKSIAKTRRFKAHDEHNQAGEGDFVRIVETRPISRTKNWRLELILQRAR